MHYTDIDLACDLTVVLSRLDQISRFDFIVFNFMCSPFTDTIMRKDDLIISISWYEFYIWT